MKLFRLLSALLLIVTMSMGCGRSNVNPPSDFLSKKGRIALVWSTQKDTGTFERLGGQGLLDMVINNLTSGSLAEKITHVKVKPLVSKFYLERVGRQFSKHGFDAKLVSLPLNKENLREPKKTSDTVFKYDFTNFHESHGVDYVLYAEVRAFGVGQHYTGFIATGDPKGRSVIDFYLVETRNNTILGEYHTKKEIGAWGKWDNPPDYPEIIEAAEKSVREAVEEAFFGFFKWEVNS